MFCSKCGNKSPEGAAFCKKCGAVMNPSGRNGQSNEASVAKITARQNKQEEFGIAGLISLGITFFGFLFVIILFLFSNRVSFWGLVVLVAALGAVFVFFCFLIDSDDKSQSDNYFNWLAHSMAVVVVSFVLFGTSAPYAPTHASQAAPQNRAQPAAAPQTGVTLANFSRLRDGMTYSQVVEILGREGTLVSAVTVLGMTTRTYGWEGNAFLSRATVTFTNGRLSMQMQSGLR